MNNWELRRFLEVMLIIQVAVYLVVFLDIPVARQIIGFLYLSFIPGMILTRVLRLHKLETLETILFSVGLSIAFLMFIGSLMNGLYPFIGISAPLSTLSLIVTISVCLTVMLYVVSYVDKDFSSSIEGNLKIRSSILLLFLPLLSVFGTLSVSYLHNNYALLLMMMFISVLVFACVSKKLVFPTSYPLTILMIALALLFHTSLFSSRLIGADIHLEYYVFDLAKGNSFWQHIIPSATLTTSTYNSMLSITVLPSIYAHILNVEGVWVFKVIYPIIYSMVPLGLYQICKKYIYKEQGNLDAKTKKRNIVAFLGVFFFISGFSFYTEMPAVARQEIAELFFILLIFVMFNKKIDLSKRRILFIIFCASLVVSHYGLSYIGMLFISSAWLSLLFMKGATARVNETLTGTLVALYFLTIFSWNTFVSGSASLETFTEYGKRVFTHFFTDLFNPQTRHPDVLKFLGAGQHLSIGHQIGRIVFYLTVLFIVICVIRLVIERKETEFDRKYVLMSLSSFVILSMCVILPYFAGLNMTRVYHITLFFLAPLCVLGGDTAFQIMSKVIPILKHTNIRLILVSIVLVAYFLFQIGFVYEVIGDVPMSFSLSADRMDKLVFDSYYIYEKEVYGARWLSNYKFVSSNVYADYIAKHHVLTSYAMIPQTYIHELSNTTETIEGTYVYLRRLNVVDDLVSGKYDMWNITEIPSLLNLKNKIYSNGGSEIYGR